MWDDKNVSRHGGTFKNEDKASQQNGKTYGKYPFQCTGQEVPIKETVNFARSILLVQILLSKGSDKSKPIEILKLL